MNKVQTELNHKAELNLRLLKWIRILTSTWFWLGIWILYYLKFTDYAGIGLLETIGFTIAIILEIPAGINSDRFGHKNNLIMYTAISLVGFIMFAMANSFWFLVVSVILARGSYAFFSGSYEALVHESLNYLNKRDDYQRQISNNSGISLVVMAFSGLIGGIVWGYNFRLSLWLTVPFLLIAFVISFKLTNFQEDNSKEETIFRSLKDGARYIFKPNLRLVIVSLLSAIILRDLFEQIFDAALKVASGMSAYQMGMVSFVSVIVPALVSLVYSRAHNLHKQIDSNIKILSLISLLLSVPSLLMSKLATGLTVTLRAIPGLLLDNTNIEKINKEVPSKHRSTAISSYSFIKALPYAVFALPIGKAIDAFGVNKLAFTLSLISLFVYLALSLVFRKKKG